MYLYLFPSPTSPLSTRFQEKLAFFHFLKPTKPFSVSGLLPEILSSSFRPQLLGHFLKQACPHHPGSVKSVCCVLSWSFAVFLHWTYIFICMTIVTSLSYKLVASVRIKRGLFNSSLYLQSPVLYSAHSMDMRCICWRSQ